MKSILANSPELLLLLFLIVTFLQSGLDKLFDWKGNLSWLKTHFANSPFKNMVPLLTLLITVFEALSALLCIVGFFEIIVQKQVSFALYGSISSCMTLLMLLLGQRLAKDYEGAKTIVVYFIPSIVLVILLQLS
ncbi:MAG: DoxX family membrane protein [Bacteroidota bacterium]